MDFAAVKGAYDAVAFAKSALEALIDAKANAKAKAKVSEALERLGGVQDVLFSLREELGRLQEDNTNLREKLRAFQSWEKKASSYSLAETDGGAVVYYSEGPPKHYACPRCFEKSEIQILQDRRVVSGTFACPGCGADFPVKPRAPVGAVVSRSRGGFR